MSVCIDIIDPFKSNFRVNKLMREYLIYDVSVR